MPVSAVTARRAAPAASNSSAQTKPAAAPRSTARSAMSTSAPPPNQPTSLTGVATASAEASADPEGTVMRRFYGEGLSADLKAALEKCDPSVKSFYEFRQLVREGKPMPEGLPADQQALFKAAEVVEKGGLLSELAEEFKQFPDVIKPHIAGAAAHNDFRANLRRGFLEMTMQSAAAVEQAMKK